MGRSGFVGLLLPLLIASVGIQSTSCLGHAPDAEPEALLAPVAPKPVASTRGAAGNPVAAEAAESDSSEAPQSWGVQAHPSHGYNPEKPDLLPPEISDEGSQEEKALDDMLSSIGHAFVDASGPRIASVAKETWVYSAPYFRSHRIGYLRAGAVVRRSEESTPTKGCKGGFYKIEPAGYVCLDKTSTLEVDSPAVKASVTRPKMDGLPYEYAIARLPGPPFYTRIPSKLEQQKVETDLGFHLREAASLERDPSFAPLPPPEAVPSFLADNAELPGLGDEPPRGTGLVLGRAKPRAGFAILDQFDVDGRRFGMTPDLLLIPLDRTRHVVQSSFHGLALSGEKSLPVAFVMKHHATAFVDDHGRMVSGESLGYRDAIELTGKVRDGVWLETKGGGWLKNEDVRRIDAPKKMPAWATGHRKWIDVSILKQSLVAYDGDKPMYVTLVSTGADGLGDPKKTHSTIQGVFLIHTKHVTVTMDNDDAKDQFDLRDVPFVQYFTQGYALHAAYWHDDFGTPRSHGCVNLAPIDAAWLFGYTTPNVPDGWHAALSLHKGTLVYTHP